MTNRPPVSVLVAGSASDAGDRFRLERIRDTLGPGDDLLLVDPRPDGQLDIADVRPTTTRPLLAFVNDRVLPMPGWIDALTAALSADEALAAVSAEIEPVGHLASDGCTWRPMPDPRVQRCAPAWSCGIVRWSDDRGTTAPASLRDRVGDRAWALQPRARAMAWDGAPRPEAIEPCGPVALVLDACTPTPDQDAGSEYAFLYIKLLRQLGWRVMFVPVSNYRYLGRYTDALADLGIETLHAPGCHDVESLLKRRGEDIDLVMLFRVKTANDHLDEIRRWCPRARTMFMTVDLHFLRERRESELTGNPMARRTAERTATLELSIIDACDMTTVVSDFEVRLLSTLRPAACLRQLPLIRHVSGLSSPFEERRDVAFIGGFRHTPNVDAVLHFVERIWPRVKAALPDARFHVVGPDAPEAIRRLEAPGVVVRGQVADLAEVLDVVRLTVAPLRFGAGQKGKIVSSFCHGVPVVTTNLGAEGMSLENRRQALLCDEPDAFADAVVDLYNDAVLWRQLSEGGLSHVAAHFSIEAGRERLSDALQTLGFGRPVVP